MNVTIRLLLTSLIVFVPIIVVIGIIVLVVFLKKKNEASKPQNESVTPATEEKQVTEEQKSEKPASSGYTSPSSASSSTPASLARIFINGGRPASGNYLGSISVDSKPAVIISAAEIPIEIPVTKGRHHLVVTGGIEGDARVDRVIEFDTTTVFVLDMPGYGDRDLIRYQTISYSEYRASCRQCGYDPKVKRI